MEDNAIKWRTNFNFMMILLNNEGGIYEYKNVNNFAEEANDPLTKQENNKL